MVEELDGVTHARRIILRRGGDKIRTNTFVLTFSSQKPPMVLKVGYLTLKVTPYIPRPMRCFKCQRYGHSQTSCRRTAACCRCGKGGHSEKDCKSEPRCLNCQGPHAASSKECPKWKEEEAIQRYRAQHGGTFAQARAAVIVDLAPTVRGKSFANVVRSGSRSTMKCLRKVAAKKISLPTLTEKKPTEKRKLRPPQRVLRLRVPKEQHPYNHQPSSRPNPHQTRVRALGKTSIVLNRWQTTWTVMRSSL